MDKIKTRKEINSSDKWSIDLIYKDVDSFNKDFKKVELEIEKLIELSEVFTESSEKFKEFFIQDEVVSRLLDKLAIYAHCKNDEDKTNSKYQEIKGKITNLYAEYSEKTSSVIPNILKMNRYELILNKLQVFLIHLF